MKLTTSLKTALDSEDLIRITKLLGDFIRINEIDLAATSKQLAISQQNLLNERMRQAILNNNNEKISSLLTKGADLEERHNDSDTLLMFAARNNRVETLKILLEEGADINYQNKDGWTALHWTVISEAKEAAQFLINAKANIDIITEHGDSPLLLAVYFRKLPMVELLLENGANYKIKNNFGYTALKAAQHFQYNKILLTINNFIQEHS